MMIVRNFDEECRTPRRVVTPHWQSVRLLLKADEMGFSFHITTIRAGARLPMHYKNHLEAVYCIAGNGRIEDVGSGTSHALAPGVIYALNQYDRHVLHAESELQLACVFNPPLSGREVHDETGAYPLIAEDS